MGVNNFAQSFYLVAARPGIELTTSWSLVRRPNHYAIKEGS